MDTWKVVVSLAVVAAVLLVLGYFYMKRKSEKPTPIRWMKLDDIPQEQLTHCDKYRLPMYVAGNYTLECKELVEGSGERVYTVAGRDPSSPQFKYDGESGLYIPSSYDAAGARARVAAAKR